MKALNKTLEYAIWVGVFSILTMSCEDKINPALENAAAILVVDAWLNNKPEPQEISLSLSQSYFDNTNPQGVSGAVVMINDDKGKTYSFAENDKKPGNYLWTPAMNEVFGAVGNSYTLTIQINGETFQSVSKMGRVPPIDSITFEPDKRIGSTEQITRADFWATDPLGKDDAYWIRSYKNGIMLNKPSEINFAYDAGFSEGGATDGVTFITPIRRRINPNDKDADGKTLSPFVTGDSLNVQIHSITKQAFSYLNQVSIQTDRPGGFQELFSTPLANVSTNISNTNTNGRKALGFFNVAAVSMAGKRFKK